MSLVEARVALVQLGVGHVHRAAGVHRAGVELVLDPVRGLAQGVVRVECEAVREALGEGHGAAVVPGLADGGELGERAEEAVGLEDPVAHRLDVGARRRSGEGPPEGVRLVPEDRQADAVVLEPARREEAGVRPALNRELAALGPDVARLEHEVLGQLALERERPGERLRGDVVLHVGAGEGAGEVAVFRGRGVEGGQQPAAGEVAEVSSGARSRRRPAHRHRLRTRREPGSRGTRWSRRGSRPGPGAGAAAAAGCRRSRPASRRSRRGSRSCRRRRRPRRSRSAGRGCSCPTGAPGR